MPPKPPDLLPHPPKVVDLREIEGVDTDLLLHQAVLHLPLICLRAPLARVSLKTLVLVTTLIILLLVL